MSYVGEFLGPLRSAQTVVSPFTFGAPEEFATFSTAGAQPGDIAIFLVIAANDFLFFSLDLDPGGWFDIQSGGGGFWKVLTEAPETYTVTCNDQRDAVVGVVLIYEPGPDALEDFDTGDGLVLTLSDADGDFASPATHSLAGGEEPTAGYRYGTQVIDRWTAETFRNSGNPSATAAFSALTGDTLQGTLAAGPNVISGSGSTRYNVQASDQQGHGAATGTWTFTGTKTGQQSGVTRIAFRYPTPLDAFVEVHSIGEFLDREVILALDVDLHDEVLGYSWSVEWGDGSQDFEGSVLPNNTDPADPGSFHEYAEDGTYTVTFRITTIHNVASAQTTFSIGVPSAGYGQPVESTGRKVNLVELPYQVQSTMMHDLEF